VDSCVTRETNRRNILGLGWSLVYTKVKGRIGDVLGGIGGAVGWEW
jgi:hypothetical protein